MELLRQNFSGETRRLEAIGGEVSDETVEDYDNLCNIFRERSGMAPEQKKIFIAAASKGLIDKFGKWYLKPNGKPMQLLMEQMKSLLKTGTKEIEFGERRDIVGIYNQNQKNKKFNFLVDKDKIPRTVEILTAQSEYTESTQYFEGEAEAKKFANHFVELIKKEIAAGSPNKNINLYAKYAKEAHAYCASQDFAEIDDFKFSIQDTNDVEQLERKFERIKKILGYAYYLAAHRSAYVMLNKEENRGHVKYYMNHTHDGITEANQKTLKTIMSRPACNKEFIEKLKNDALGEKKAYEAKLKAKKAKLQAKRSQESQENKKRKAEDAAAARAEADNKKRMKAQEKELKNLDTEKILIEKTTKNMETYCQNSNRQKFYKNQESLGFMDSLKDLNISDLPAVVLPDSVNDCKKQTEISKNEYDLANENAERPKFWEKGSNSAKALDSEIFLTVLRDARNKMDEKLRNPNISEDDKKVLQNLKHQMECQKRLLDDKQSDSNSRNPITERKKRDYAKIKDRCTELRSAAEEDKNKKKDFNKLAMNFPNKVTYKANQIREIYCKEKMPFEDGTKIQAINKLDLLKLSLGDGGLEIVYAQSRQMEGVKMTMEMPATVTKQGSGIDVEMETDGNVTHVDDVDKIPSLQGIEPKDGGDKISFFMFFRNEKFQELLKLAESTTFFKIEDGKKYHGAYVVCGETGVLIFGSRAKDCTVWVLNKSAKADWGEIMESGNNDMTNIFECDQNKRRRAEGSAAALGARILGAIF